MTWPQAQRELSWRVRRWRVRRGCFAHRSVRFVSIYWPRLLVLAGLWLLFVAAVVRAR